MKNQLKISPAARQDIRDILAWTQENFGERLADRYYALLIQVLRDIAEDPERIGSKERPEVLPPGARLYHFHFSRNRVAGERVKSPRHFVLYRRLVDGKLEIARILHDSRDLERHLPDPYKH